MDNAHYLIHRVNLDIEAPDLVTARRVQDEAVRILHHWILPKLEQLLKRLVPEDIVYRLDTLDLDLNRLDSSSFEQDFGEALLRSFTQEIEGVVADSAGRQATGEEQKFITLAPPERLLALLLHFLKTGTLPWWSEQKPEVLSEEAFIELAVFSGPEAAQRLFRLLDADDTALTRLFLQFSPVFVSRLLLIILEDSARFRAEEQQHGGGGSLNLIDAADSPSPRSAQREFLRKLLGRLPATSLSRFFRDEVQLTSAELERICRELQQSSSADGMASSPAFQRFLDSPLERSLKQPRPTSTHPSSGSSREDPASPQKDREEVEGIYVNHAGLVLLHPFLEYFFKEFNLLQNGAFLDSSARDLAIHLLHYLAVGEECPSEYLLTLEKFLCGAELLCPIPRFIRLSDPMKAESEKLLQAAIGHWQALKRTSPAGLREGFLQRSGKLLPSNFQNRLIIEGKSHDVLLNYLPWGYGIIKLPWLQQPLFVDWTS